MDKENVIINKLNINPPEYDINYYAVRNNAWDFLIKNKVKSYPLDLRKIATNNNWQIWSYNKYCQVYKIKPMDLIKKHPDGFTEILNNSYVICYNQNNDKYRNRFTIAHEIGHIVLHQVYKGKKLEKEANMFAARILMPMLLIKELNLNTPEELTELCNVSIESATFRMKRYNEIKNKNKFYTNPLETKLLKQLGIFLQRNKKH